MSSKVADIVVVFHFELVQYTQEVGLRADLVGVAHRPLRRIVVRAASNVQEWGNLHVSKQWYNL